MPRAMLPTASSELPPPCPPSIGGNTKNTVLPPCQRQQHITMGHSVHPIACEHTREAGVHTA